MVRKATFFSGEPCRFSLEFLISDIEKEIEEQNASVVENKMQDLDNQMTLYKQKAKEASQILEEKRRVFKKLTKKLKDASDFNIQLERDIAQTEYDIEFFIRSLNEENPAVSIEVLSEKVKQLKTKIQLAQEECLLD